MFFINFIASSEQTTLLYSRSFCMGNQHTWIRGYWLWKTWKPTTTVFGKTIPHSYKIMLRSIIINWSDNSISPLGRCVGQDRPGQDRSNKLNHQSIYVQVENRLTGTVIVTIHYLNVNFFSSLYLFNRVIVSITDMRQTNIGVVCCIQRSSAIRQHRSNIKHVLARVWAYYFYSVRDI